jgi:hypothetical protein
VLAILARTGGAALLASCSLVTFATPASAEDCVFVDGNPELCVNVTVVPTPDTFNGATVTLLVDVDVCTRIRNSPTCERGTATLSLGPTGLLLNGVGLGQRATGDIPVHVPEVCFNTTCVGPYDTTIPSVDLVCITGGSPSVVVGGTLSTDAFAYAGTC